MSRPLAGLGRRRGVFALGAFLAFVYCKPLKSVQESHRSAGAGGGGPLDRSAVSTPPASPVGTHYVPAANGPLPLSYGTKTLVSAGAPVVLGLCPGTTVSAPDMRSKADEIATASGLSNSYQNNCAGCHGYLGQGRAPFPQLTGASAASFASTVRTGKGEMPAFATDRYTDLALTQDQAALITLAGNPSTTLVPFEITPLPALTPINDAEYKAAMDLGLAAWRDPGLKGACSQCHGPDGSDLAYIGYSASDVMRRAIKQGRTPVQALAIADMIDAKRRFLGISDPCAPALFRPLQPGGRPLKPAAGGDGATLDGALASNLASLGALPPLAQINAYGPARDFADAVLKLAMPTVPIGVSFDLWSNDTLIDVHDSTAEWIPELAMEAKDKASDDNWTQLENLYLARPSDANFWTLYEAVGDLDAGRFGAAGGVAERLSRERLRSVLLLQHMMRSNTVSYPDLHATKDLMKFAVWETAQVATVMLQGCAETDDSKAVFPCWGYPQSFYDKIGTDRSYLLTDHQAIVAPWLLAGLVLDPGLQFTENGGGRILDVHNAVTALAKAPSAAPANFLPLHQVYFGMQHLFKATDGLDESFQSGFDFTFKTVNGCWNTLGGGTKNWQDSTLAALTLMGVEDYPTKLSGSVQGQQAFAAAEVVNLSILYLAQRAVQAPNPACVEHQSRAAFLGALTAIANWGKTSVDTQAQKQGLLTSIQAALK